MSLQKQFSMAQLKEKAKARGVSKQKSTNLEWLKEGKQLKIVSLNILAHELMMYFWRSSYGLPVIPSKRDNSHQAYYDEIHLLRIRNIVKLLKKYDADIVCLQEVTDISYLYLQGLTMQKYIASLLGYQVISESYKQSKFQFNYPPNEQMMVYNTDSGVATLLKRVDYIKTVAVAEQFGQSELFNSGVGSPMTIDTIRVDNHELNLVNVHVRMLYPNIKKSVQEIYGKMKSVFSKSNLKNTIVIGDFNAHERIAAKELFTSGLSEHMSDVFGSELIDDHVFIGRDILKNSLASFHYDDQISLLDMNVNKKLTNTRWTKLDLDYTLSKHNTDLIKTSKITTDHYPIVGEITFGYDMISSPSLYSVTPT